jgi:hypothetical protein
MTHTFAEGLALVDELLQPGDGIMAGVGPCACGAEYRRGELLKGKPTAAGRRAGDVRAMGSRNRERYMRQARPGVQRHPTGVPVGGGGACE